MTGIFCQYRRHVIICRHFHKRNHPAFFTPSFFPSLMDTFGPGVASLLGLLEGLTEYLPVSSTGHLILLGHWLNFTGELAVSVEICIQLGAVLAVVAYERTKIVSLVGHAYQEQQILRYHLQALPRSASLTDFLKRSTTVHRHFWFLIGLGAAFLPAALVGFLAHDWIKTYLFSPQTVAVTLIIGGIILLIVETWPPPVRCSELTHLGPWQAVGIGLAQCMALIPGTSRSGATIVGGLLLGLDRRVATEFSFFLALPTMFAATGYTFVQSFHLFNAHDALALALGTVVSFLTAWAVIAAFLSYVKRHSLRVFGYYRIVLGATILFVL